MSSYLPFCGCLLTRWALLGWSSGTVSNAVEQPRAGEFISGTGQSSVRSVQLYGETNLKYSEAPVAGAV